jgi:hypoxanthine-DNA glycosylase
MDRIYGFPPAVTPATRVLVLGSMPSVASLEIEQYYGKPQNAFWRIMGALFDAGPEHPYATRLERLNAHGVGLWDVVASCVRPGSLDSNIRMRDVEVNDFAGLLDRCPLIAHVFFNGRKSEEIFNRWVSPALAAKHAALVYHSMPSTSPAMAALGFTAKLDQWGKLKQVAAATQEQSR